MALVMLGCTCNTLKLSPAERRLLRLTPLLLALPLRFITAAKRAEQCDLSGSAAFAAP